MRQNPITATIDFTADGVQHGFLHIPHSRNDSAWGAIMMPCFQIKKGDGPTALITGGNHGDEYEGPLAIFSLAHRLDASNFSGRAIFIPAMNYPAFCAATRVSPIDSCNLNRIFPGRPDGSITEQIADYFSSTLLPMAEFVLDLHSGGKTLDFLPFAAYHPLENKVQEQACRAAMEAMGTPYMLIMHEIVNQGLYDTQAEEMGKVFVSTELGGAGTTTPESVSIAERGIHNFLVHAGILNATPIPGAEKPILLDNSDPNCFICSEHAGLVRAHVTLGQKVEQGQLLAEVYEYSRSENKPISYHARKNGMVISRHVPSLVQSGDCLNVIAEVIPHS